MFPLFVISAVAAFLAGITLLWIGLWPRRSGSTPHCRQCNYNLTGLPDTGDQRLCPECGNNLRAERAVAIGERRRRPLMYACGALLVLVGTAGGVAVGVAQARKIDWYTLKPTFWVVDDLRGNDATLARRSFRELRNRSATGKLSAAQEHHFLAACLELHARTQRSVLDDDLIELLTQRYYIRLLPSELQSQFLRQIAKVRIEVRPRVIRDAQLPARCVAEWRGPSKQTRQLPGGFDATWSWESLECDGQPAGRFAPSLGTCAGYSTFISALYALPTTQPGQHRVVGRLRCEVFEAPLPGSGLPLPKSIGTWEQTYEAEYEVLDARPRDFIKLRRSPELDRSVAAHVWLEIEPSQPYPRFKVCLDDDIPIGVAFELLANDTPVRMPVGEPIAGKPGAGALHPGQLSGLAQPGAGKAPPVTLRLRASPAVAEETTDLFEIWDGELVFESVDLKPSSRKRLSPKLGR